MTKLELFDEIQRQYEGKTITEAAVKLLREVATDDQEIFTSLKENGVTRTIQTVQHWCRTGELEAYKLFPGKGKARWVISLISAQKRILAEKLVKHQRTEHATRGLRGQVGRPNTGKLLKSGKITV